MKNLIQKKSYIKKHQTQHEQPKSNLINIKVMYSTKQLSL